MHTIVDRYYMTMPRETWSKSNNKTDHELCSVHLGIEVSSTSELSNQVCKPCGRKIRNASELIAILNQTRHKRVACVRIEQIDCTLYKNVGCQYKLSRRPNEAVC
jgi:hypothetical protein